jgi:hypothetical protein
MNPTTHSIESSQQENRNELITLEQMDVLCRKCHQLHDERILILLSRSLRWAANFFKHKDEEQQHPHPSVR